MIRTPEIGPRIVLPQFDDPPAHRAGAAEQVEHRFPVARADRLAHEGEIGEEAVHHFQHRLAVVQEHVAPHGRIAGGDAGEIAEAPGGELDHFAAGDFLQIAGGADDGVGDQVRDMAGDGEHAIMVRGFHHFDPRSQRLPERHQRGDLVLVCAAGRSEDAPALVEEAGKACVRPRLLGARHRVRRDDVMAGERLCERVGHAFLG